MRIAGYSSPLNTISIIVLDEITIFKLKTQNIIDGLVKSQKLELLPQLIGIAKVVNTPYIAVTKILPDFLRNHHH